MCPFLLNTLFARHSFLADVQTFDWKNCPRTSMCCAIFLQNRSDPPDAFSCSAVPKVHTVSNHEKGRK